MTYLLHILILIGIYIILAGSLNLLAGYTGILSMAHAAFYGLGAYVAALMALHVSSPFLLNLVLAMAASAVLGGLVAFPALRIKDDYFVIATFAFQVITFSVLNNWVEFTGGPMGLPGIPQPRIGIVFDSHWSFLLLTSVFALISFLACKKIVRSPFGRVLKSIREDEVFSASVGINVPMTKVKVFMVSAAMASVAGVLYATYITYIDPTSFTVMESIFIVSVVIIGGAGRLWGPVVGAVILVALPELLRFIGLPNAVAANIRQMLYGGLLVVFMLWRPRGLVGENVFSGKKEK